MINRLKRSKFLELMEENQDIIHKICNLYAGNEEDRRDLSQEIVYQLWKSYRSYRGAAKFTTWMYRVALNTALHTLRRSRGRKRVVSHDVYFAAVFDFRLEFDG